MIQSIKDKLEMAEAFLESAALLEQPLYRTVLGDSEEEIEARKDKQRYQRKKACHFLYAIIFELAIKIIWEVEKGEECEHKHHILKFYKQLPCESQLKIKELYGAQASMIRTQEGRRKGNRISVNDLTKFQSLGEALKANYGTVTGFKYNGLYEGKSSVVGGVIWNEEIGSSWILPERFVVFPREILKYAKERVDFQAI